MEQGEENIYNGVGRLLSEARQSLGFEIEDIAAELKISRKYLAAIEDGAFDSLPGGRAYIVGYLSNYARLLRLDPDMVVDRFAEEKLTVKKRKFLALPNVAVLDFTPGSWIMTVCALAMLVIYSFWLREHHRDFGREPVVGDVPSAMRAYLLDADLQRLALRRLLRREPYARAFTPVDPPATCPPIAPDSATRKRLAQAQAMLKNPAGEAAQSVWEIGPGKAHRAVAFFEEASWVTLRREGGGAPLWQEVARRGEALFLPNVPGLTMDASNAGDMRLWVDGEEIPPPVPPGVPFRGMRILPESRVGTGGAENRHVAMLR